MASLITVRGPTAGRRYPLDGQATLIGRQPDAPVCLESLAVSRHHARIVAERGAFYVEDLGSSNGTFLNGTRISGLVLLTERDVLQIGPYELGLLTDPTGIRMPDPPQVIRARVEAVPSNATLFAQNPAQKLQVVLEIAQHLGSTLEIEPLLNQLLEQLFRLFTQADRGMVLLCERDRLVVRAQRLRHGDASDFAYSRTIVKKALDEGVGILSEDVGQDSQMALTATIVSLNLRSFLCVPLIGWGGKRLGVLQLDTIRPGNPFRADDLELLTAVALQCGVVLQNAAYHAERLKEERLRQEVLLARDIQQQFLPSEFGVVGRTAELYAHCQAAREVSGDLYDFFRLNDRRLVFYLGDVSGKGMPAALFMIAVRTLARHLGPTVQGPAELLSRLNVALTDNNPTNLYVTIVCGIYDARDGSLLIASGGHPPPLLRRASGSIEALPIKPALLIGSAPVPLKTSDFALTLQPGDTLIFYTDGYTEAFAPDGKTEFGLSRLCDVLTGPNTAIPLEECAAAASRAVEQYRGDHDQHDDQTLLLLRRR